MALKHARDKNAKRRRQRKLKREAGIRSNALEAAARIADKMSGELFRQETDASRASELGDRSEVADQIAWKIRNLKTWC
jgi:hypothetical protein